MHARAWWLGLVLGLGAIAAAPSRGVAQPATVQAQSLFDEGRRLMKAGKLTEACAAFEASQKLDPAVTTLLNLADCREQNHQLATAWGLFVDANRLARDTGNDKLAKIATGHARKLEPRLSRLAITVPPDRQIAGLAVLRGKDPIDPVSWNHALPIDGGSYTITARAPGREPWSTTRTIKVEGDTQTIEVPVLAELKPAAPAPPVAAHGGPPGPPPAVARVPTTATGPAAPATPPAAPRIAPPAAAAHGAPAAAPRDEGASRAAAAGSSPAEHPAKPPAVASRGAEPADAPLAATDTATERPSRALPIALGVAAVGFGGGALAFHLWGNRLYDRAGMSRNQADRDALFQQANTRRYLAEGFGVAALGCAGVAVYLYLRGGDPRPAATVMTPVVSPGLAGLAVVGSW